MAVINLKMQKVECAGCGMLMPVLYPDGKEAAPKPLCRGCYARETKRDTRAVEAAARVLKVGYHRRDLPLYGWCTRVPLPTNCLTHPLQLIGEYNRFGPMAVRSRAAKADPGNRVLWHVGREYSPVLYAECPTYALALRVVELGINTGAKECGVLTPGELAWGGVRTVGAPFGARYVVRLWWD